MELQVVRTQLCGEAPFDGDYLALFDGLVDEAGWDYPPRDMDAADDLYRALRASARLALDIH